MPPRIGSKLGCSRGHGLQHLTYLVMSHLSKEWPKFFFSLALTTCDEQYPARLDRSYAVQQPRKRFGVVGRIYYHPKLLILVDDFAPPGHNLCGLYALDYCLQTPAL